MKPNWLPLCLLFVLCSLTGCGQDQESQTRLDKAELRKSIRMELMSPQFKKLVQDALAKEDIRAMVQQTIESPDGQRVVGKVVLKQMGTEEVKTKVNDATAKALDDPKVKKAIGEALAQAAQQMLMKAASGGDAGAAKPE